MVRSSEDREPSLRRCLSHIALQIGVRGIFLINDSCGRTQSTNWGAVPGQVALGNVRNLTEQAREIEPEIEHLLGLCYTPCLQIPALSHYPDFSLKGTAAFRLAGILKNVTSSFQRWILSSRFLSHSNSESLMSESLNLVATFITEF